MASTSFSKQASTVHGSLLRRLQHQEGASESRGLPQTSGVRPLGSDHWGQTSGVRPLGSFTAEGGLDLQAPTATLLSSSRIYLFFANVLETVSMLELVA